MKLLSFFCFLLFIFGSYADQRWTNSTCVTFSYAPDGTLIGGTTSTLYQTLNGISWQTAIQAAAATWQDAANINLAFVSDNGNAFGVTGNQQGDSRFGDIRFGALPFSSGLGAVYYCPDANGGTLAGDTIFSSGINWPSYDVQTVALRMLGHAIGLQDSSSSISVMYPVYTGQKRTLSNGDILAIQAIYGIRQADRYKGTNININTAADITSLIDGNGQITLSGLSLYTSPQNEYFKVTVPSSNSGTMTVVLQATGLSSLSSNLMVIRAPSTVVYNQGSPGQYGTTLTASVSVTAGQVYYIRAYNIGSNPGRMGAFGIQVNFGTQTLVPIPSPNTATPEQPGTAPGSYFTVNA